MNGNGNRPKVLVIGGGTGASSILKGLKRHPTDITAIVTMFDSGGSSGVLSEEFGFPPFGDLRQCLLALGEDSSKTEAIRKALDFRFEKKTSLNGHSVGNLLLAALTSLSRDLERALDDMGQILNIAGRVIPVTLERAELCAELENGEIIKSEVSIDQRAASSPRIARIFLEPSVKVNPRAVRAITEADAIVFGPGDLYTSVLPNLLPEGVVDAITSSKALRIYMCNLMTKRGETDGFSASDFAREVCEYLWPARPDWVVVNSRIPESEIREAYAMEGAHAVTADLNELTKYVSGVICAPVATEDLPIRHDPQRAAEAIFQAMEVGRLAPDNKAIASHRRASRRTLQMSS